MKKTISVSTLLIGILISTTLFTSCSKEEIMEQITENTIDLSNFALSFDEFMSIAGQIESIKRTPRTKNADADENLEQELRKVLEPLISVGKELHTEMLNVVMREPTITLTAEEYKEISKVSYEKFVELALFAITIELEMSVEDMDDFSYLNSVARECLRVTTGIDDFLKLYVGGTRSLLSANTTRAILRVFGVRALGKAGIAYMAYLYGACIRDNR